MSKCSLCKHMFNIFKYSAMIENSSLIEYFISNFLLDYPLNDQFIGIIIGALSNETKMDHVRVSSVAWFHFSYTIC